MPNVRTPKKQVSEAERIWREWNQHERNERRYEREMWFFSAPSGLLRSPGSLKGFGKKESPAAPPEMPSPE